MPVNDTEVFITPPHPFLQQMRGNNNEAAESRACAHSSRQHQSTSPISNHVGARNSAMKSNSRSPQRAFSTPRTKTLVKKSGSDAAEPHPAKGSISKLPSETSDARPLTARVGMLSSVVLDSATFPTEGLPLTQPQYQNPAAEETTLISSPGASKGHITSIDALPVIKPTREHTVLVTEGRHYLAVTNGSIENHSFYPFSQSDPATTAPAGDYSVQERQVPGVGSEYKSKRNSTPATPQPKSPFFGGITERAIVEAHRGSLKGVLQGNIEERQPIDVNDPINNFTFFVGAREMDEEPSLRVKGNTGLPTGGSSEIPYSPNVPFGSYSRGDGVSSADVPPNCRDDSASEAKGSSVPAHKRSFTKLINNSVSFPIKDDAKGGNDCSQVVMPSSLSIGGYLPMLPDSSLALDEETMTDTYRRLPMHQAFWCTSSHDLEDDTVSFTAVWEGLKSDSLARNILFGFRVTLFAVLPTFLLCEHPKTRDRFVSGILLPILAGLVVRPSLGGTLSAVVGTFQTVVVFMTWGVIMNAVGAKNNLAGWWCGAIFGCALFSLFGDLPSKRLMMTYVLIIMQIEHMPGGDTVIFVLEFAANVVLAAFFAALAAILPYPIFVYKQADEGLLNLHMLHSAGLGNAMKSFWAPVSMDAKMALTQIPFLKIDALTSKVSTAIKFATYEPIELNLNNLLRGERLAFLQRIKMHLYAMSAASANRLENVHWLHRSQMQQNIQEFEKRVQTPAMDLAGEVMKVLVQLGSYLDPHDVSTKVSFVEMAEKTQILSDIIDRQQTEMLLKRTLSEVETNACIGLLGFHYSLVDISMELQRFEDNMKTFDMSRYPSIWRRAFNFFFYDRWNDFWSELPKRFTMNTPYDIRLLKDTIRYTGGFAVACAFILHYDREHVYYFGMSILLRLAQQTASETLSIGIHRICGLCIGASLAYITVDKMNSLTQITALTMVWVFISMCFSLHPVYGSGAQYVAVISLAGLRLATSPVMLLTSMTDNVFAFISYYLICTFIFPLDPIRVLWNIRTKCFISINSLAQTVVSLGCAPITRKGEEPAFLLAKARALVKEQQSLLNAYADWMPKCNTEPTIRGGDYPAAACANLRIFLSKVMSLEEALVSSMERLHRCREKQPGIILCDMMELTRPFLLDASKLIYYYCQCMIDATEKWRTWSMEESLHTIWKTVLACRSLHRVTGNIQRNFYAAVLQVDQTDKQTLNTYLNASFVDEALSRGLESGGLLDSHEEDLVRRLLARSIQMSKQRVISRDDIQAFNALIIVFELLFKSLGDLLPPMIQIYEYEKSRHV